MGHPRPPRSPSDPGIAASPLVADGQGRVDVGFPPAADPTERHAKVLAAIREASMHHGWATATEIGKWAGVVTNADALQLARDLVELHAAGLIFCQIPPIAAGPKLYRLTSAGREAAA